MSLPCCIGHLFVPFRSYIFCWPEKKDFMALISDLFLLHHTGYLKARFRLKTSQYSNIKNHPLYLSKRFKL